MVTVSLQAILLKYTTHLLRHTVKKCPQRIIDTPAVLFCRIPCIYIVYFKRLTERMYSKCRYCNKCSTYQNCQGGQWFQAVARFVLYTNLVVEQRTWMYAVPHACGYFFPCTRYIKLS